MEEPILGVSWWVWAAICFIVATLYAFVAPKQQGHYNKATSKAINKLVLRYGHSLVWVLLGTACLLNMSPTFSKTDWPFALGISALVLYVLFMTAFRIDKFKSNS